MEKYNYARAILGNDFISPEEIAKTRGIIYGEELLLHFAKTLPAKEVLQWLHDYDCMLMAGTPNLLSLMEIRNLKARLFNVRTRQAYDNKQRFFREGGVGAEWLMLRKSYVFNSINKTWDAQQERLSDIERVPNASEVAWGITTYMEIHGVSLFSGFSVRTSSVCSKGFHVCVGDLSGEGVDIEIFGDDECGSRIGLASARK